jgi:hypothetical protein
MAHWVLLKGHITAVVPRSLVDEYAQRDGLIPANSIVRSGPPGIDASDMTIVYVQREEKEGSIFYRIMGDENRAPD